MENETIETPIEEDLKHLIAMATLAATASVVVQRVVPKVYRLGVEAYRAHKAASTEVES